MITFCQQLSNKLSDYNVRNLNFLTHFTIFKFHKGVSVYTLMMSYEQQTDHQRPGNTSEVKETLRIFCFPGFWDKIRRIEDIKPVFALKYPYQALSHCVLPKSEFKDLLASPSEIKSSSSCFLSFHVSSRSKSSYTASTAAAAAAEAAALRLLSCQLFSKLSLAADKDAQTTEH